MISMIEHVFLLIGKKPPVTKRIATITDRVYDISKAEKDLDFNPKVSMVTGIKKVVSYYKRLGLI